MDESTETIGIIFPLLPKHARRFLENGKTVFVKFFGNQSIPLRLRVGSTLFFYESDRNKEIVGEAKITRIHTGTAEEAWSQYGPALFLTSKELKQYAADRLNKKMLILTLKQPKRYSTPLQLKKSVTMTGRYMTKQMFDELKKPHRDVTI